MKIKDGANLQGMDIRIRPALVKAGIIWWKFGHELVVTCGLDGAHSSGSLHYYGLAVDLRSRYFNTVQVTKIVSELANSLGPDFDVIRHKSHIHVEYDRKMPRSEDIRIK